MEKTYKNYTKCPNCGANNELDIPMWTTINEKIRQIRCFHCGCRLAEPKYTMTTNNTTF